MAGTIDTTQGRAWVITWTPECCSFYNGSYFKSDLAVALRYHDLIEFARIKALDLCFCQNDLRT